MNAEPSTVGSPPRSLPSSLSHAAQLVQKSASSSSLSGEEWDQVAVAAEAIADGLKNHELRTALGNETETLPSVGKLMERAIVEGSVKAKMELCRVVGNACFDHDENRQLVLDANIPLFISKIIDSVTRTSSLPSDEKRKLLRLEELRMLRASVGAILNSSLKFDPIRRELGRSEILESLLSLIDNRPDSTSTKPVYCVGMQLYRDREVGTGETEEEWQERLTLGETIAGWTMNVLEDVLSEDNKRFPSPEGIPILASILLSVPIPRSSPSATSSTDPLPSLSELSLSHKGNDDDEEEEEEDEDSYLDTSIELLSISAALLEGLTLDHDIHKQTISLYSYDSSSPSPSLLYRLLEFTEFASPPTEWTKNEGEKERLGKTFEVVKAATIRAVVEGMNDDRVMHELWKLEGSRNGKGGNWLVETLVAWLEHASKGGKREDLMVCASHMLAGLGRSDQYVERLVHEFGLVDPLARIVKARVPAALLPASSTTQNQGRAGENTQILYGVVSLIRHLAIPLKNRPIVSATRIIPTISQLLSPSFDIVKPLQMSVVGLLKHLTSFNITSSVDILSAESSLNQNPLDLILALIKRSDELQLRSESTRVLINLVRSLFSTSESPSEKESVEIARETVLQKEEIVTAISEQVRLSEKYPILVNEGIVALSLLSGGTGGERGASIVLSSLLQSRVAPLPGVPSASITEEDETSSSTTLATRQPPKRTASLSLSPSGDPPTSLDMLIKYLSSISTSLNAEEGEAANIPPEMISNVCTLLITTIKNSSADRTDQKEEMCHRLKPTVRKIEEDLNRNDRKEWERVKEAVQILSRVIEE
ncbi:hypothetical protein JCM5350_004548 [Sporobolomyces pararoseus]